MFFRRTRNLVGLCWFGFLLVCWPDQAAGGITPPTGDIHKSPVFFEMFDAEYIHDGVNDQNIELLPAGRVYIAPFGVTDLGEFSWETGRKWNLSWALGVENFKYLLPLIDSPDENHRQFVKNWFLDWFEVHHGYQKPNHGSWNCMTAAIRSMALTFFLKREEVRDTRDTQLIIVLMESLNGHLEFLAKPSNFNSNSNHGMWGAIALVELARVFPNSEYMELGLSRLLSLVRRSVSEMGIHLEHAPGYHFAFLKWLDEYVEYLNSLTNLEWSGLKELERYRNMMLEASYYLYDHQGNIAMIGDTDEKKVKAKLFSRGDGKTAVYFDEEAGYAVFKDITGAPEQRYFVFNIQKKGSEFPYHFHDDALAVYFSSDGEVILGDQGKYEYVLSPRRKYFISVAAHNITVPSSFFSPKSRTQRGRTGSNLIRPHHVAWADGTADYAFTADIRYLNSTVKRKVIIPKSSGVLTVTDMIIGSNRMSVLWNLGHDISGIEAAETVSKPEQKKFGWRLRTRKGKMFFLSLTINGSGVGENTKVKMIKGQKDPLMGWYSPSHEKMVPSTVIILTVKPLGRVDVITRLIEAEVADKGDRAP